MIVEWRGGGRGSVAIAGCNHRMHSSIGQSDWQMYDCSGVELKSGLAWFLSVSGWNLHGKCTISVSVELSCLLRQYAAQTWQGYVFAVVFDFCACDCRNRHEIHPRRVTSSHIFTSPVISCSIIISGSITSHHITSQSFFRNIFLALPLEPPPPLHQQSHDIYLSKHNQKPIRRRSPFSALSWAKCQRTPGAPFSSRPGPGTGSWLSCTFN